MCLDAPLLAHFDRMDVESIRQAALEDQCARLAVKFMRDVFARAEGEQA